MPYRDESSLPDAVKSSIPSKEGRKLFREVVNSSLESGKTESAAMASAWAALKRAGYVKGEDGKWVKKSDPSPSDVHVPGPLGRKKTEKRQVNDDIFTTRAEAEVRAVDLGLDAVAHLHEIDGQAYFMPGSDHVSYLAAVNAMETGNPVLGKEDDYSETEVTEPMDDDKGFASILKVDEEQRMVWGWAYVSTRKGELLYDTQGDSIRPEVMVKAASNFMLGPRTAKRMHKGEEVGTVVHSFPMTKEVCEALQIKCDMEGWLIAMKVWDDDVWSDVKSGLLPGFSIGGKGMKALANV